MTHPFVQFLIERHRQDYPTMSDAQFASDVLGVCKGTWSLVQAGKRGIGRKLINVTYRRWPNRQAEIEAALRAPVSGLVVPRPMFQMRTSQGLHELIRRGRRRKA